MNRIKTDGIQFILCPAQSPDPKHIDIYNQIYEAWRSVWTKTYLELKDDSPLYSDSFTRQDFIASIFLHGECVAFILFRHVDLSLKAHWHDSYFQQWTEIHLKKATLRGQRVLICGNLGIIPSARQTSLGFSMKHMMLGLITEIALHSAADVVISTPRQDKGVHSAVYRWGGVCIAQNIDWGLNVTVDLTAFYQKELLEARNHELVPTVESLWSQRLVIREDRLESVNSFLPQISFQAPLRRIG